MANWPLAIMVYGGGEAIDGASALAPYIQRQLGSLARVCTNRFVAATAQLDASRVPTRRMVLDPAGRQPVLSLPNVDVGDPASLGDFVAWSGAICPADRTVLVLSGHGAAWQDSQVDALLGLESATARRRARPAPQGTRAIHHPRSLFGSRASAARRATRALLIDGGSRDYLSNAELGAVCEKIATRRGRPIDVLVFDACLMSAWETLHELRGSVSTVVASIDELSAAGIVLDGAAAVITAQKGAMAAADVARTVAARFSPQASFDSCVAIDLSAAGWADAVAHFRTACAGLLSWTNADAAGRAPLLKRALAAASGSVVKYQDGGLADVRSLATALAGLPGLPPATMTALQESAKALQQCVLALSSGEDYRQSMGLSIFSPNSRATYLANRAEYGRLQFAQQTRWLAVLDAAFK
ncbi:hypothetical protein EIP75_16145 [Aquabacterium soli]|uniref:Clostripain n=1 Tax=Aquabacterium soli TaxID=2493092 RepID=A0A3R8S7E9_9BURK|nr:clostripain-related cysteine peptidase [Aquabacterium soli]RRS03221.1 hypothetical protein EIP75_16145 [Aquabacterium soli]